MTKYNDAKNALDAALRDLNFEANSLCEKLRLRDLQELHILDSEYEDVYDDLMKLTATVTGSETALITFVDESRTWIKSNYGKQFPRNTKRCDSFCNMAIQNPNETFIIIDAYTDERVKDNYWVKQQGALAFYAGIPLLSTNGRPVGAVCVVDDKPRVLTAEQHENLKIISRIVTNLLHTR